jgi:FMN phosphatase YigB (HAD superfamily)
MPETTAANGSSSQKKTKTLGLITFDLDDTLYPIEPVLSDANKAFSAAMERFGYSIDPEDIVKVGKQIREDAGAAGVSMSHTEVRLKAIKKEMERVMFEKKLKECAEDWATEVSSLTAPLKNSAKK